MREGKCVQSKYTAAKQWEGKCMQSTLAKRWEGKYAQSKSTAANQQEGKCVQSKYTAAKYMAANQEKVSVCRVSTLCTAKQSPLQPSKGM